jgi:hypothetical protein
MTRILIILLLHSYFAYYWECGQRFCCFALLTFETLADIIGDAGSCESQCEQWATKGAGVRVYAAIRNCCVLRVLETSGTGLDNIATKIYQLHVMHCTANRVSNANTVLLSRL